MRLIKKGDEMQMDGTRQYFDKTVGHKYAAGLALCVLVILCAAPMGGMQLVSNLSNPDHLLEFINRIGPVAVVVLLALAVVVSPIPSGPIAMAAGAALGPVMGGSLTAMGALLGALLAFGLSRGLGYRPLATSNIPMAEWITRPRTPIKLALAVLVSRLIPFISFDAVSYVAGLTTIRPSHFAAATAVGVLPASFAFAAIGAGMAEMNTAFLMIAACGVTVILPIGWAVLGLTRSRQV